MVVDEGNAIHCHLQWAKILVRSYGRKVPRMILHVVVRVKVKDESNKVKCVLKGKWVSQEEHLWLAKGVVGLAFST
ncbi:hypothetical protein CK203_020492 [Vitis vinifera]|uniref:Uncharacterized protein n=1 Tax=Vitis vinifera TaxID=29760 RepID=A0A438FMK1_VITVI|nr:hypothetical protein CK203_020492 [Vitis vinifera]